MIQEIRGKTLAKSVSLTGFGLHSGEPVTVQIYPGDDGIGFRINNERIEAIAENVTDTTRCTRLGQVSTVEHVMSALSGLGITDAEIELSAFELPALDGSSRPYCEEILKAGFEELSMRKVFIPFNRIFFQEDSISIAVSKGDGKWSFRFDCGDRWPKVQEFAVTNILADYYNAVAPARTFAFEEEVEMIQKAGLAKGLDEKSALILGKEAYLNEPRFQDEPARHKLLDLVGDLALARIPAHLINVTAVESGHRTNVLAAKKIRAFALAEPTGL